MAGVFWPVDILYKKTTRCCGSIVQYDWHFKQKFQVPMFKKAKKPNFA